jgi:uncharacterized protein (DUF1684 family)
MDLSSSLALVDYRRRVAEMYLTAPTDGEAGWLAFRRARDELFLTHSQSALRPDQKQRTDQLPYFPYDPQARVEATVEPLPSGGRSVITIDTGGVDGTISYRRLCRLATPYGALTLLWMLGYGGGLFLPFRDGTSGRETYGGGRYLTDTVKGTFGRGLVFRGEAATLDFNYAYNPSCAYASGTFCPLAPVENMLPGPVRAGELSYPFPS